MDRRICNHGAIGPCAWMRNELVVVNAMNYDKLDSALSVIRKKTVLLTSIQRKGSGNCCVLVMIACFLGLNFYSGEFVHKHLLFASKIRIKNLKPLPLTVNKIMSIKIFYSNADKLFSPLPTTYTKFHKDTLG